MVLAEKGGQDDENNEVELLVAGKKFRILATMNPGGDFGKKEVNVKTTRSTTFIFWSYLLLCECRSNAKMHWTNSGIQYYLGDICFIVIKED